MDRSGATWTGPPRRSLARVLATTALGTVVPGAGLVVAGRRKAGVAVLCTFALLVGACVYFVVASPRTLLHWSVQPAALLLIGIALPTIGGLWALTVVATYRSVRTTPVSLGQRVVGSVTVFLLVAAVAFPHVMAGRYALVQRSVIEDVFAAPPVPSPSAAPSIADHAPRGSRVPATSSTPAPTPTPTPTPRTEPTEEPGDPWAGRTRVNILLLGGDGGPDRVGVRTDTVIVASVNTRTGDMVLLSLPRNLQRIPFQRGSVLAKAYPGGIYAGPGDKLEWMLTAIYHNVPLQHPGLLRGPHPGAEATKLAVAGALRMRIDYYALVNLKGFVRLIDALGGITVNVNGRVAIGGEEAAGLRPHSWIRRGPHQQLDGFKALWFARGRYGASDWDRMERQRCVIKAIVDQASPLRVLSRYESLVKSSRDLLTTDVPTDMLPAFVDLALKAKDADISAVTFTNDIIHPANPDYAHIRALARNALRANGNATQPDVDSLAKACAYH